MLKAITGELNSMILPFSVLDRCSGINPMPYSSEIPYLVKVGWRLFQGTNILNQVYGRLIFFSLTILLINCISSQKNSTFSAECEAAAQQTSCSETSQIPWENLTAHDYEQHSQADWLFLFYLVQSPVTQDIVTVAWNDKFHCWSIIF